MRVDHGERLIKQDRVHVLAHHATTEPEEALLLGGNTATLWEGRVTQFGPSMEVYREPVDEITARAYSDPPMNFVSVRKEGPTVFFPGGESAPMDAGANELPDGDYRAGFRAHDIRLGQGGTGDLTFGARVSATELTGSETFLHLDLDGARWIGLVRGPQDLEQGANLRISLRPSSIFYFDDSGKLASAPQKAIAEAGV
ncbi:MAG: TOBE domain-containing protein [Pseudomonadota bacterium]